jgi:type I restriction-modification system DNA methylase subunit
MDKGREYENSLDKDFRKQEGIFYSPNYITNYIVNQAVSNFLEEQTDKFLALQNIKIIDLACGAGAFLLESFDFLLQIYRNDFVDFTNCVGVENIKRHIIANNLFGVDVDLEAVALTQQQLFLQSGFMCHNIKTGNSLIADKTVTEKAFVWETQFAEIMADGGFDVVVGNPPYVVKNPEYLKSFNFVKGNNNTYIAFFERGFQLMKLQKAVLGFIVPTTFFSGANYENFRNHLLENYQIQQIIQLPYDVFEAYIDTAIIILSNIKTKTTTKVYRFESKFYQSDKKIRQEKIDISNFISFPTQKWREYGKIFLNDKILSIGNKFWFAENNVLLGEIAKINRGCLPPKPDELSNKKTEKYNIAWFSNQVFRYHIDKKQLIKFVDYQDLKENKDLVLYQSPKILARQLVSRQFRINMTYTEETFAFKKNLYAIYALEVGFDLKYILAILNSKLFSFCQVNFNTSLQRDDFPAFSLNDFKNFPILKITEKSQLVFAEKVTTLLKQNEDLQQLSSKVFRILKANFELKKVNTMLENWFSISERDFLLELEKQKIKISMNKQIELFEFLEVQKAEAISLYNIITETDKHIDNLVYKLYDLSAEEIEIIEKSFEK